MASCSLPCALLVLIFRPLIPPPSRKLEALEKRFSELRALLISRDYRPKIIDNAIEKARKLERTEALKRVPKKENDRVVFVLDFNPCLPSVSKIVQSAWRVMTQDPMMKKIFPKPMMVAFRRPTNLREKLAKAITRSLPC